MPELPEVETMCRGIAPIVGQRIRSITTPWCSYRAISIRPSVVEIDELWTGSTVTAITRLGKRVVVQNKTHSLILQPKMTGLVALDDPPDQEHVRLQLDFVSGLRLLFWDRRGLGTVEMMPTLELHERLVVGKLGPDALQITPQQFTDRLRSTRRPIKVALLDQKLLAGVGNLYASEMLFAAQINPRRPAAQVSKAKLQRLYEVMQQILRTAIEMEGSTLSDGTYRNAINDPGSYQNMHLVYDRAGETCRNCRSTTIRRIVQSQRSTFYCPRCQK